ncbi:hypothetical protein Mapa_004957 [Marchantia paleacea]|nr:hypothetical protein Mapa_004957 [Marchantia paleacea]
MSRRAIPKSGSLQAVLFDVDGTLCESDALHFKVYVDMLQEAGYNGGVPISEEIFKEHITGKFNTEVGEFLWPDWDPVAQRKFTDDKETNFRRLAETQLITKRGLNKFCDWLKEKNIRRAAVTNAPRINAEQMIKAVGLGDFFEHIVIGYECERAKPFPDPYLVGLKLLGVPADKAFAVEDSKSGLQAAVDAQLAVVGIVGATPGDVLMEAGAAFTIEDFEDPALWKAIE